MKDLAALNEMGFHYGGEGKPEGSIETFNSSRLFVFQGLVNQFQTHQTNFYKFDINVPLNQTFTSQLYLK